MIKIVITIQDSNSTMEIDSKHTFTDKEAMLAPALFVIIGNLLGLNPEEHPEIFVPLTNYEEIKKVAIDLMMKKALAEMLGEALNDRKN